ncbi:MAG: transposase [Trichodesmium erythraeum GBRTRLIN201]|nr:transposase [Trichodesmium erythraeum GBRTRLIN201]
MEYFGSVYRVPLVAVESAYTSQNCPSYYKTFVKTLSSRIHRFPNCVYQINRDIQCSN